MNGDVIREFLVGLGFQVDEAGLRRFNDGLAKAAKGAMNLAKEVVAAGAAVAVGVVKIASQFEDLFYASQRLRSSVADIKAFTFAVGQVGGDAKGARQDLENMMRALRENPGNETIFAAIGAQSRNAKGEMLGAVDLANNFAKAAKKLDPSQYPALVQYAEMLGISEQTLQAMIRGTDEFADRYKAMAKSFGMSQDEAAESSAKFRQNARFLLAWLELAAGKLAMIAEGPIGRLIDVLAKADKATGGLASTGLVLVAVLGGVAAIVGPVAALVLALAAAILLLWDDFQTWKEGGTSLIDWDKWAPGIDAAMAALAVLWDAVKALWSAIVALGETLGVTDKTLVALAQGGLAYVAGALNNLADLIKAIAALLRGDFSGAWDHAAAIAKRSLSFFRKGWEWFTTGEVGQPDAGASPSQAQRASGGGGGAPAAAAINDRAAYVLAFLKRAGINDNAARGATAGAEAESRLDPSIVNGGSGAFGIGQWLGPRKRELFRRYGRNPTLDQQLEFLVWELKGGDHGGKDVLRAGSAQAALNAYITKFMRPAAGAETSGDLRRGGAALARMSGRGAAPLSAPPMAANSGGGTSISQETNINVAPGPNAEETARRVAAEQSRINADLYRNQRGAMR